MAQPQHSMPQMAQIPAASYPQAQHPQSPAPSPAPGQPGFQLPPNKRPRMSPPSQPGSPYPSPLAASPTTALSPSAGVASPGYQSMSPAPQQAQHSTQAHFAQTTYTNGHHMTPQATQQSLPFPQARQQPPAPNQQPVAQAPQPQTGHTTYTAASMTPITLPNATPATTTTMPMPMPSAAPATTNAMTMPMPMPNAAPSITMPSLASATTPLLPAAGQYTTAQMAPISATTPTPGPLTPGVMGPPSKPAERPVREYEYDVGDSLAGTGIDIRQEEQLLADYFSVSFNPEARNGFPAHAPGSRSSFYGAGAANQEAQEVVEESQGDVIARTAEEVWYAASLRLANSRKNEIQNPFLDVGNLHRRFEKIAKENGIGLNLDLKNQVQIGKFQRPQDWTKPTVLVKGQRGPDGYLIETAGSWIPHDAFLVDSLALLSIATKHRVRDRLEDADMIALTRQHTSHGEVPTEWLDAAAPLNLAGAGAVQDGEDGAAISQTGEDGAVISQTNSLKRSFETFSTPESSFDSKAEKNIVAQAVRDGGKTDRSVEEARLKKRQKRLHPEPAQAGAARGASAAPGTPGSVAPDPEAAKAPTKKETKKSLNARMSEISSTASANQSLSTLMGGFGRKKKGKSYSWMTAAGSGASTPRAGVVNGGSGAATPARNLPEKLTMDGRYRLGSFREDGDKGKHIQLRDWVVALELDGLEAKAIQDAYDKLDASEPK